MKKYPVSRIFAALVFCLALCLCLPHPVSAEEGGMVEGLTVSSGKKGFCPGKGKSLSIKAQVNTNGAPVTVRIRIYNKKGKYVFQKSYQNSYGGQITYKWNGKPGKKNKAKASHKKYAKKGKYTVEVCVIPQDNTLPVSVKTVSVQITAKENTKGIPVLTGDMEVDYMAEQICREAGIKDSLSEDEKVRRIYHWMTVNQKHVHYYSAGSYPTYFKLASSKKKIKSYRKKTDQLSESGDLIYSYDTELIRRKWCMERRIGVCTDNAAIFKILCSHVGVESGICSGNYLNRNGTKPPHSWNYAVVGGVTYYYDVDVEIQNYGKGQGDYYWYKKTRAEAERTHRFVTVN